MPVRRSDDTSYSLARSASATGSAVAIRGGNYMFTADGTVGGATISLQIQLPSSSTWTDVQVFSASAVKTTALPYAQTGIELPSGNVRMAVTGGAPSGLSADLVGLG